MSDNKTGLALSTVMITFCAGVYVLLMVQSKSSS